MDIGDWLRGLGLGQYEGAFRDNGVDGAVLPKLNADDLRELGVAGGGHRRKIISAIEELNAAPAGQVEGVKPVPMTRAILTSIADDPTAAQMEPVQEGLRLAGVPEQRARRRRLQYADHQRRTCPAHRD
jgi:hypothetical protein